MIVDILALIALALIAWLFVRAKREHTSIMTVLHAEISEGFDDLSTDIQRLESKVDGGVIPQSEKRA